MKLELAKKLELSHPQSVEAMKVELGSLIRDALETISLSISTKSTSVACITLLGYLITDNRESRGEGNYRGDFVLVAHGIKREIERLLPPGIPTHLRLDYAREIAMVLTRSIGEEMLSTFDKLEMEKKHPALYWFAEFFYRKN